jgi:hypothetical protein
MILSAHVFHVVSTQFIMLLISILPENSKNVREHDKYKRTYFYNLYWSIDMLIAQSRLTSKCPTLYTDHHPSEDADRSVNINHVHVATGFTMRE